MKCWKCGFEQSDPPDKNLPFRATCDKCGAWLHCCKNCQNYKPGLPNDCVIPGTEYIADREAINFCEEFKLRGTGPEKTGSVDEAARRLFGDEPNQKKDDKEGPKGRFDSLFRDF
jgi:hypothetical protein